MIVLLKSFAYRTGVPKTTDLVIDCRHLPNPWVATVRGQTGKHPDVQQMVLKTLRARRLIHETIATIQTQAHTVHPPYTVAVGCIGGRHRSVVIADEIARQLLAEGHIVWVEHTALPQETTHG